MKNKSILITGANIGLGKEVAKQLALIHETEKIFLGCRNRQRADEAKKELEDATGRSIFEIIILDVSNVDSVRNAVSGIKQSIDALILNAGGQGGKHPEAITSTGMTTIAATNLLGHVVLVDELIKAGKLNNEVLYVSSEGARGIKGIMKKPDLKTNSVSEFISVLNGSFSEPKLDGSEVYGYRYIKYIGTLWTSANARKYPQIKFISVSPGNTRGTAGYDNLPTLTKFLYHNNQDEYSRSIMLTHLDSILKYSQRFYRRQFLDRKPLSGTTVSKFNKIMAAYFEKGIMKDNGLPTVNYLAGELNLSPRYLSDLLKQETGKTAIELIHLFLISEAKNLLTGTDYSVSEIAYKLGFENPPYFFRLFKKETGMSPNQFKKYGIH